MPGHGQPEPPAAAGPGARASAARAFKLPPADRAPPAHGPRAEDAVTVARATAGPDFGHGRRGDAEHSPSQFRGGSPGPAAAVESGRRKHVGAARREGAEEAGSNSS